MRFSTRRELKRTKIEIIPMIDTMFFLLVFFILASLSIIDLRGLNLELPPAGPAAPTVPVKDVQLVVRIDAQGKQCLCGRSSKSTLHDRPGENLRRPGRSVRIYQNV